jgi:alpha-1,2-mannosyltransferase
LIPLVHRSGGPLLDIVVQELGQPTGFHASTPEDYARQLVYIFSLSDEEQEAIRQRARSAANRKFSEAEFEKGWMIAWRALRGEQDVKKDKMT